MRSAGSATRPARVRAAALVALGCALSSADPSVAQSISVSGNPAVLRVSTATAGSAPNNVTNFLTTYSVTTPSNGPKLKITARLSSALPPGVTLTLWLQSPGGGAVNQGTITLTTTDQDVITNMDRPTNAAGRTIVYTLSATSAAGVVALSSRVVTLTLQ